MKTEKKDNYAVYCDNYITKTCRQIEGESPDAMQYVCAQAVYGDYVTVFNETKRMVSAAQYAARRWEYLIH